MTSLFASRRQRRRRPGTARTLLVLIACTFMILSTLSANPVSARQDEVPSDQATEMEGQEPTETTEQVEPQDEPVPTESPEDIEPLATEEPEPEAFTLVINKWDCDDPATTPYGSTSHPEYQAACDTPMSVQFEASNSFGYYDVQVGSSVTFTAPSEFTMVSELLPDGYTSPAIFCNYGDGMNFENDTNSSITVIGKNDDVITCDWFNRQPFEEMEDPAPTEEPGMGEGTEITIWKYECPAGYDVQANGADPLNDCTTSVNGVNFTLDHPDPNETDLQTMTGDSIDGAVYFGGLLPADYTIIETPPMGIESAFVWNCYNNGMLVPGAFPLNSGYSFPLSIQEGDNISCNWFNVPEEEDHWPTETPEPGYVDLYIYKYTCPAGYNPNAATADPVVDCAQPTNGINFTLTDEDPNTADLMTMTGDSVDGAVYFGGLEAGNYTVIETVPAGIASVFVLDCENALDGMVRPVPFSTGDTLELPISGYEGTITCDWYNVPASPHGQVTVIKYSCTTETFVSEVDCEIYEHGQGFDLFWWDGASWVFQVDGTTDGAGMLTFTDLEPGTWQLDEEDASWCAISSDDLSSDGSSLHVEAGEETIVKVYNCGAPSNWTTPTKYPNTGVAPVIVTRP